MANGQDESSCRRHLTLDKSQDDYLRRIFEVTGNRIGLGRWFTMKDLLTPTLASRGWMMSFLGYNDKTLW